MRTWSRTVHSELKAVPAFTPIEKYLSAIAASDNNYLVVQNNGETGQNNTTIMEL
jgi:hypothetical protein